MRLLRGLSCWNKTGIGLRPPKNKLQKCHWRNSMDSVLSSDLIQEDRRWL
jgi:hypothetical protein